MYLVLTPRAVYLFYRIIKTITFQILLHVGRTWHTYERMYLLLLFVYVLLTSEIESGDIILSST